jgi:hypothetical protein
MQLTELSDEDVATLLQRGLSSVVDLRFDRELEERPNIFKDHATVKYHHNPVLIEDPAARGAAEAIRTLDFRASLAPMLDVLESEFGGIAGYLEAIGVTPEELAVFRRQFHVEL